VVLVQTLPPWIQHQTSWKVGGLQNNLTMAWPTMLAKRLTKICKCYTLYTIITQITFGTLMTLKFKQGSKTMLGR